jgi:hypothetical protein
MGILASQKYKHTDQEHIEELSRQCVRKHEKKKKKKKKKKKAE